MSMKISTMARGTSDHRNGKQQSENPYTINTYAYYYWNLGWLQADQNLLFDKQPTKDYQNSDSEKF